MKEMGEFLKNIRKQRGLTQEQVAERLNISTPVLSKWENDKALPSLDMLCKLCNVLNVSIEECIAAKVSDDERVLPPKTYDTVKLGATVKKLRIKSGLSQAELGKELFVTSQTVSKWESGGITSLEILKQLAELYNISPTNLLNDCAQRQTAVPEKRKKKHNATIKYCVVAIAAVLLIGLGVWGIVAAVQPATPEPPSLCLPISENYVYRTHNQHYYNYNTFIYSAHVGVDFQAEEGTEVYAVADGTITIKHEDFYGATIYLSFDDYRAVYRGINPLNTLKDGLTVEKGGLIATVSTPFAMENADGTHLHFELWRADEKLDPLEYLPDVQIDELTIRPSEPPPVDNSTEQEPPPVDNSSEQEMPKDDTSSEQEPPKDDDLPQEEPNITMDWDYPVKNVEVIRYFETDVHDGVDFAAKAGTVVYAIADGIVLGTEYLDDMGCAEVTVDHGDGIVCIYRNLTLEEWLPDGTVLKKGNIIGTVQMPDLSDELSHLHLEIRLDDVPVDPFNGYLSLVELE